MQLSRLDRRRFSGYGLPRFQATWRPTARGRTGVAGASTGASVADTGICVQERFNRYRPLIASKH